ncbi:MAG: PEP-CTERM sorting domain-containing protein [Vicinamibacterales bacterium]
MRRSSFGLFVLAAAILGWAAPARAATIMFNTSDNPFDAGIANQGWWSATADNSDGNDNYFTGWNYGAELRSFFTFDLSGLDLTGQVITGATLDLTPFEYASADPSETLGLFDVSTDAATLNANDGASAVIFDDLGSGTSYGSFAVPAYAYSDSTTLTFALADSAISDIAAAQGGWFSIGAALTSLTRLPDTSEAVFSGSGTIGIQRLTIETAAAPPNGGSTSPIPEPGTLWLLGAGLLAGGRRYLSRPVRSGRPGRAR